MGEDVYLDRRLQPKWTSQREPNLLHLVARPDYAAGGNYPHEKPAIIFQKQAPAKAVLMRTTLVASITISDKHSTDSLIRTMLASIIANHLCFFSI